MYDRLKLNIKHFSLIHGISTKIISFISFFWNYNFVFPWMVRSSIPTLLPFVYSFHAIFTISIFYSLQVVRYIIERKVFSRCYEVVIATGKAFFPFSNAAFLINFSFFHFSICSSFLVRSFLSTLIFFWTFASISLMNKLITCFIKV